ncbi:MAG TPA: GNAT family N-acetyltransferase [Thermomonospora sp.]|nr:GNAT family N-acetyltransferase [Thermomonospora sp.]
MFEVREVPESDLGQVVELAAIAFHERDDEEEDRERHLWLLRQAVRVGAYEGDRLVGFVGSVPLRISVPGGSLPCGGVTDVVVMPTHRRRGILTAMMGRLWEVIDEPLAALYASEATIYGRYGFGSANRFSEIEVHSDKPWEPRIEADPRPLRMVSLEEAPKVLTPLYERAAARRPGQIHRDEEWWRRWVLRSKDFWDENLTQPRVVVLEDAGYVVYRTKEEDETTGTPGVVQVMELEGDSPAVEAALWRYLASIDLTRRIQARSRPVDDLVQLLAADPDTVRVRNTWQALWLRLADLPAALERRGWAEPVDVVLDVADARLPANAGRWRLRVTEDTATCERTDASPDLSLDVRELGAVYLGGTPLTALARTGIVAEHTPGTAQRLDRSLNVPLAPYTVDDF